jgi:hypothetical protein
MIKAPGAKQPGQGSRTVAVEEGVGEGEALSAASASLAAINPPAAPAPTITIDFIAGPRRIPGRGHNVGLDAV